MKSTFIFCAILLLLTACSDTGIAPIITRPKAPVNAVATVINPTAVRLAWEDRSDNEEGFVISRGSRKFGWIEIRRTGPNVVTYLDTFEAPPPLSSAGRVSYIVQAYNRAGSSQVAVSNEIEIQLAQ